ncbi:PP2C family protein-serine/threonine phosphatase [Umezawaea tangerina]|uniref:Protein phosphatase n=1 Tax=Umezawaea tangerina TaxID=84725 RepID=A0A2T0T4S2_9PSEU|nr:protein phosphatase 2C domain-containing protein [Umezawaea tangerina]PRY40633.1 protein phosphatase [Umezawaea tangerina]
MLVEQVTRPVRLTSGACSERGRRTYNADATGAHRDPVTGGLAFAVADGIGDSERAGHAARLAATTAAREAAHVGAGRAVAAARAALEAWQPGDEHHLAGDAVLVAAAPRLGGGFTVAWAGDARAYFWDGAALTQLTTDQTVAEYFREHGQKPTARMEHVVTNSVRLSAPATIGLAHAPRGPGRLVLTSDGVHGRLTPEGFRLIMAGAGDPGTTAALLVATALRAGGTDNATALVVDVA